jgi:hypothetical protein
MIDADDPAYDAYAIDQWENKRLVLTSSSAAQSSEWNFRWVYELRGVGQFKISFETKDGTSWKNQSTCVCQRIQQKRFWARSSGSSESKH